MLRLRSLASLPFEPHQAARKNPLPEPRFARFWFPPFGGKKPTLSMVVEVEGEGIENSTLRRKVNMAARRLKPPSPSGKLSGEAQSLTSTAPNAPKRKQATSKRSEVARVKAEILKLREEGHTVADACRLAGKSPESWKYYRRTDPDFKEAGDLIEARRVGAKTDPETRNISFEAFSEKYLNSKLFRHQLQWIDLLEGREPRDLHPGQTYLKGDPDTIIVNTPPGHAKSTTITMNYVTYKIATNPDFRVVIISKTEAMAKKFLAGIKRRLTGPQFAKLQIDFAPPEGFERSAEVWSSKMIYFGHSDSDQKDPTVEVLGIGQQIYGARADLIILDDVEDLENAHNYAKHLDYVMQDVLTRDAPLLVVGTRVGPVDIYSELLNPEHYDGETSDWTYLSQPAILETADDPEDWVTLWPYSDRPHPQRPGKQREDGLWPKWDGPRLSKLRKKIKPSTWQLVYMQQSVDEDMTFTIEAIHACQSGRARGEIPQGDYYMIAGLDPASSAGFTACVVLAVDRRSGKRYLIDVFNRQVRADGLRRLIEDFTEKYHINEWRVEKNAFQSFLTQDREINRFLAARGVRLKEHSTQGGNKWDPNWGVASLDALFRGWQDKAALIDLPGLSPNEAYRQFKEQLITWYPDHPKTQKTDLVMALWFAETSARDVVKELGNKKDQFFNNPFVSQNDLDARVVIDIDEYIRDQRRFA